MQNNTSRLLDNKLEKLLNTYRTQLYFGWVLFIGIITLIPGSVISGVDWNFLSIDKIIHFSIFLILSFLGSNYFLMIPRISNVVAAIIFSLLMAVGYGTLLELSQTYIPDRGFDYADLSANIVGTFVGLVVFYFYSSWRK